MKHAFFLLTFCLVLRGATAQHLSDADSLFGVLQRTAGVNDSNRVKTLLNLANILIYSNTDSSMKYTREAMGIARGLHWAKGVALSLRERGYIYYVLSDYVKSMDDYIRALQEAEVIHSSFFNATIYNNIANIYADLKNYDKALDYYAKYLAIAKQLKSSTDEMNSYINIGDIYTEMNNLPLGLDYFNRAYVIASAMGNQRIAAAILNNIGEISAKEKKYAAAFRYFQQSLGYSDSTGNNNVKASVLNNLAEIYLKQHDYPKAEIFSKKSLVLSRQLNDLSWQANALATLSKTYEAQGDFRDAYFTYRQADLLNDSILNSEKKQDIARVEMQYDFDKRATALKAADDKKQALAAAEINREKVLKNAYMGIGIILVVVAIAAIVVYKRRKDTLEKKKEAEFRTQVAYTELKALRAQMNPHFIYNSLNSINDYVDKHDTAAATLYTTKFAKLMRMILENSERKEIPLSEDLTALELYMQLESMRMRNRFTYEINVDGDIDPENTLIPPLILQPFVENSIWHGISKKQELGKIVISIHREGAMINCVVQDNGIGMKRSMDAKPENDLLSRKSLGMKITRARIDIINKMKNSNAAITASNLEDGTRIEIKIPEVLAF